MIRFIVQRLEIKKKTITNNFVVIQLNHVENIVKNLVNLIKILKNQIIIITFDDFIIIIRNIAKKKRLLHTKNSLNAEITISNRF